MSNQPRISREKIQELVETQFLKASNHQIKLSSIYDLIVNGSNINCRTFCGLLAPELTKNGFSKK
jgi:hypothetical protein